jgi:hypothetical protein
MRQASKTHRGKQAVRRHFIAEWLEAREMEPMDLVNALNATDASLPMVDKSQVYRWLKGQMPHADMQVRIAGALSVVNPETGDPDPSGILRHPDYDWMARQFEGRSKAEIDRMKQMIELAFPARVGTRN